MTDLFDTPGAPDRDELASAYLDGEAALDELALVEADIDHLRRVEELGAVRDRLAVDALPAVAVDAQITAALDAFDELAAAGATASPVTDLASRRRPWTQQVPFGAVAAAVVVVALVAGVAALATRDTGSSDLATSAPDAAIVEDDSSVTDLGGAGGGDAGSGTFDDDSAELMPTTGASGMELRQVFAGDEALVTYVRGQLDGTAPAPASADASGDASGDGAAPDETEGSAERSSDPCDAVQIAGIDPAQVRVVVPIVLAGDDATAVGYTDGEGVDRLVVVRDATCEVTLRRAL